MSQISTTSHTRLWIISGTIILAVASGVAELVRELKSFADQEQQLLISTNRDLQSATEQFFNQYVGIFQSVAKSTCIQEKQGQMCDPYFRRLNRQFPTIVNFAATDKSGRFFASGKIFNRNAPPSISHSPSFIAIASGSPLFIMDPHVGPITSKKVTGVAIPLLDPQDQFDGIIGASLKLESLTILLDQVFTRHGVEGLVFDRHHKLVGRSAGLANLESLDDILRVIDIQKSTPDKFTSGGVSYTFSSATSEINQWHFVTIKPTLNPFKHLLVTNLGWVTLIFGFVILALYALLIVRREGKFVERLINTEEMLRRQRNKLEALTEEQTSDIRQKDQNYRHLFDNSEVSIWNEDFSAIHATFKKLRSDGVSDLHQYLDENPEIFKELISQVRVTNVNKATLKLFCAKSERDFMQGIELTFGANATMVFKAELEAIWDKKPSFRAEAEFKTLEGNPLYALLSFQIPKTEEGFNSIPVTILDITESKQSENALRLFRGLVEESNDSLIICSADKGRILDCNKKVMERLGYSYKELLNLKVQDVQTTLPDEHSWQEHVKELKKKGGRVVIGKHIRKDGSTLPVEVNVRYINYGDKDYTLAIARDITERFEAEATVKVSEERLREAQAIARIGSFEGANSSEVIWWSDELYKLFNLDPDTFTPTKQAFFKLIHPDDRDGYIKELLEVIDKGGQLRKEYRVKVAEDNWRFFETIGNVTRDNHGQVSGLRGTVQDITFRKETEEALFKGEQRLHSIIDAVPSMIFVKNREGRFLAANKAVADSLRRPLEEIIGKLLTEIHPFYDDVEKMLEDDRRVFDSGQEVRFPPEIYHDGTGAERWRQTIKVPFAEDEFGEPAILGIAMDITKLKQTEEALRRTQKMEAVGQLTGGIAHDFNNIMGIILGNVQLLKRHITDDSKALKRIDTIKSSAQRAVDLTQQLLSFSRRQPDHASLININDTIRDMESLIARSVTPEVEVTHQLGETLWQTKLDPGDFQDALLNLVLNARDAMPNGGELTIATRNTIIDTSPSTASQAPLSGEWICLTISDTGEGIQKLAQERIFEPFFTTKPQGKGTGLGLAMVFGFVERSGGHISVSSKIGHGSHFQIHLPRAVRTFEPASPQTETPDLPPRGAELILVVDDEEDLLELAKESLQTLGYRVITAVNGRQALNFIETQTDIALLFSDVVMPGGLNGYELAELAITKNPSLKILLTSGYTEKAAHHAKQAQFNSNLLSKPYTLDDLATRTRTLLDQKGQLRPDENGHSPSSSESS